MPPHSPEQSASASRRKHLAVVMALLISGVVFGPLLLALYRDGSVFFLLLTALIWLGAGRFIYHLLAPNENGRPAKSARDADQ
ncbi:MAG: hypothetical protein MI745_05905 [Pseudomonadales bacterium]|nr:hypothetical protein [Pseudomonadales bacterium]